MDFPRFLTLEVSTAGVSFVFVALWILGITINQGKTVKCFFDAFIILSVISMCGLIAGKYALFLILPLVFCAQRVYSS